MERASASHFVPLALPFSPLSIINAGKSRRTFPFFLSLAVIHHIEVIINTSGFCDYWIRTFGFDVALRCVFSAFKMANIQPPLSRVCFLSVLIRLATMASSVAVVNGDAVIPSTKTIYLIRHAESEENRRLASFKSAVTALARFSWPKSNDVTAALELIRVTEQVDSGLSDFGMQQIAHMAHILEQSNFVGTSKIQLVAHSPLLRAKETARGMLGCMAPDTKVDSVDTVCELDLLMEKTPSEWIPGNSGSLYARLTALESWIGQRPENVIALVGHSQFFKALLHLDYKFGNCDVMQATFHPAKESESSSSVPRDNKWSNLTEVHVCRLQPTAETEDSE
jgi:bisphosphoglycerate-dependent phosphoglycerate mutase